MRLVVFDLNGSAMASVYGHQLTLSAIAGSLLAVFISYLLIGSIVNYRKLRQFRGPRLAAFSRLWLFKKECEGRLPHEFQDALRKYGMSST